MINTRRSIIAVTVLATVAALSLLPSEAFGCRVGPDRTFDRLFAAHVIVRATAVKYAKGPANPDIIYIGKTDAEIEFKVEEVLRGERIAKTLVLNGYLGDNDDYNDGPVPYTFVRPGGRGGPCFANTYRKGAQFLLFLKQTDDGYTSNISSLGPTNEQLRGPEDPWLLWTRSEVSRRAVKR